MSNSEVLAEERIVKIKAMIQVAQGFEAALATIYSETTVVAATHTRPSAPARMGAPQYVPAMGIVPTEDYEGIDSGISCGSYAWSICTCCRKEIHLAAPELQGRPGLPKTVPGTYFKQGNLGLFWTSILDTDYEFNCCDPKFYVTDVTQDPGARLGYYKNQPWCDPVCHWCCCQRTEIYTPSGVHTMNVHYGMDGGFCNIFQLTSFYTVLGCFVPNWALCCLSWCESAAPIADSSSCGMVETAWPVEMRNPTGTTVTTSLPAPGNTEAASLLNSAAAGIAAAPNLVWRRHKCCPCCFPWYLGYDHFSQSIPIEDRQMLVAALPWIVRQKFGLAML